jgi:Flp pilus assembly protein TadD
MRKFVGIVALHGLLLCSTLVFAASEEAAEKISLGKRLLEQGKVEAAISEFQKATTIDPKYGAAQLNLGYAYERANLSDEAIDAYRKASNLSRATFTRATTSACFILRRECMIKPSPSSRMP